MKTPTLIVGSVVGFICLCCICCAVIFSFSTSLWVRILLSDFKTINDEVFTQVCDANESELRSIYENNFSEGYRKDISFLEFKKFYTQNQNFFKNCDTLVDEFSWKDFINGFSINSNNTGVSNHTIELEFNYKSQRVSLEVIKENGKYVINYIDIR